MEYSFKLAALSGTALIVLLLGIGSSRLPGLLKAQSTVNPCKAIIIDNPEGIQRYINVPCDDPRCSDYASEGLGVCVTPLPTPPPQSTATPAPDLSGVQCYYNPCLGKSPCYDPIIAVSCDSPASICNVGADCIHLQPTPPPGSTGTSGTTGTFTYPYPPSGSGTSSSGSSIYLPPPYGSSFNTSSGRGLAPTAGPGGGSFVSPLPVNTSSTLTVPPVYTPPPGGRITPAPISAGGTPPPLPGDTEGTPREQESLGSLLYELWSNIINALFGLFE